MCSHRLDDVQDVCDRIAILYDGELQELGEVSTLLEDADRLELRASGVKLTDELRRDLEDVFRKHGGKLDTVGHPTTTLEDLFLQIVEESKAQPGRRYLPRRGAQEGPRTADNDRAFLNSAATASLISRSIRDVVGSVWNSATGPGRPHSGTRTSPGLVQAWLQDAGGFAMVGLVVYLLYALSTPTDKSQSEKIRVPVTAFMVTMGRWPSSATPAARLLS